MSDLDQTLVDAAVARLHDLRNVATNDWERVLVNAGLSVLANGGVGAVQQLEKTMADWASGKLSLAQVSAKIDHDLSLREASDFLVAMENQEADRVQRTKEILQLLGSVARMVADELLKMVLHGTS